MELIDVFNAQGEFLEVATIDDVHQKVLWHQTVAYWLFNPIKKEVYLQLRGPKNRVGANTFDATAGGHLSAGETKEQGIREVQEELGVLIQNKDVYYFKRFLNQAVLGMYRNNEFCHIYLVNTLYSLWDFSPEKGEVANIFALKIRDIPAFLRGSLVEICGKRETRQISIKEMCLSDKRIANKYYESVLKEIQKRCEKGEN